MSSHHFVKEGQEPALFILEPTHFDLASPLLEWAPYVVVFEDALDAVLSWGIRIDCIVCTPGFQSPELLQGSQVTEELVYPREEVEANVIQWLRDRGQNGVNVLAADAQSILNRFVNEDQHFAISVLDRFNRWVYVSSFEKWVPAGHKIQVRQIGETASMDLRNLDLVGEAMYEAKTDGVISIRCTQPVWIGEEQ